MDHVQGDHACMVYHVYNEHEMSWTSNCRIT